MNICRDVSSKLSSKVIEVEFYSIGNYGKSKRNKNILLTESVTKKYRFPQIPFESKSSFFDVLNSIWKSFVILILTLKYKPIALLGEYSISSDCLWFFHKNKRKVKIIIDMHGSVPEEREYCNSSISSSYIERLTKKEKCSCYIADYVICQSNKMKEHIISKYGAKPDKIFVYNCGVDTTIFKYSAQQRTIIRKELDIEPDCLVFVYSGGSSLWQKVPEMFSLFNEYHQSDPNSFFLILSKDKNEFEAQLSNYHNIKDFVRVLSLEFKQVPNYLCAADAGFLLRDDVVLNRVASPTKLAEYMACGLMVVVCKVADNWINGSGKDYFLYDNLLDDARNRISSVDKSSIVKYANEMLSLEQDRKTIEQLIDLVK